MNEAAKIWYRVETTVDKKSFVDWFEASDTTELEHKWRRECVECGIAPEKATMTFRETTPGEAEICRRTQP